MLELPDTEEEPLARDAGGEGLGCETQSSERVSTQRSIVMAFRAGSRVGCAQSMRNGLFILESLSLVNVLHTNEAEWARPVRNVGVGSNT